VGDVERVDAGRPEVDAGGRPEAGEKGAAGRSARRPETRLAFALVLLALSGAWAWLGRSRPPNAASIDAAPYFGLAVSADRRTLLFTARKQPDDDLLLIENLP
jgi:hypothetical protein